MTPTHGIRTFNDFRDAAYGFRLSRIILSALELDLFSKMGQRAWTLSALARRIKCSQRGVDILCRNLAGIGLLKKEGPTYQASHMAQQYLNRHSPDFRGAYLELLQRQWQEWSNLTDVPSEPAGLRLTMNLKRRNTGNRLPGPCMIDLWTRPGRWPDSFH
jgi:hypothetical protein